MNPDPADVDAPRRIIAPGGYQWWYFEAHDPVADLRVTAILFDGNVFHPRYLRRYAWYRRFPTNRLPPVPSEFPGAFVRVYDKGVRVVDLMREYEPGACHATETGVTIGDDGFTRADDGSLRLTIRDALDLTFQPKQQTPPRPHTLGDGVSVREPHGWIVSNPSCAISGDVIVRDTPTRIDGFGYQDHNFGAEPVHLAAKRWFWSCVWLDERSYVVAEVVPTRGPSRGVQLLDADTPGSAVWEGRSKLRIPYPTMIDFGNALRLDEPRVVEALPVMVQLRYRAQLGGVTTTALAHVVEPGRASVPLVSRLLETLMITRV